MSTAASALWASIVRTIVPLIVGGAISWLTAHGIAPLDTSLQDNLTLVLTVGFTGLYYVAVRLLETYITPKFGWLLGLAKTPTSYTEESPVDANGVADISTLPVSSGSLNVTSYSPSSNAPAQVSQAVLTDSEIEADKQAQIARDQIAGGTVGE